MPAEAPVKIIGGDMRTVSRKVVAAAVSLAFAPATTLAADDTQDQIRALKQQIEALSHKVEELSRKEAAKAAHPAPVPPTAPGEGNGFVGMKPGNDLTFLVGG